MSLIYRYPWLSFIISLILCYTAADLAIRGDALNMISGGILGWVFWIGILFLLFRFLIIPVFSFSLLPVWRDPDSISAFDEKLNTLEKYAHSLVQHYKAPPPQVIADDVQALRDLLKNHPHDQAEYMVQLEKLVRELHEKLSGKCSDDIIHQYMKRTAILVMISQRGFIDSIFMFVMQIRMITELAKLLGYRPSWVLISRCLWWILINSLLFSLLDGTDLLDEAISGFLPEMAEEGLWGGIFKFVGKSAVQGFASMALVYSSGVIVRNLLLGENKHLDGKKRLEYRLQGFKHARTLLLSFSRENIQKVYENGKEKIKERCHF